MKEKIIKCLNNLGFIIDDNEINYNIAEYIQDSISFISLIVELEQAFEIEIPDEFLDPVKLQTYDDIVSMINSMKKQSDNSN